MKLYNFTLQRGSNIVQAVVGNFSGSKHQEIIANHGKTLELIKIDPRNGKAQSVLSMEAFGIIRSLQPFRLTGSNQDLLALGSDSGRIVVLRYDGKRNVFEKLHQETFGRSGARRIVPGQYLAADPRGRAVLIAAAERQKFVFIMNRDSQARVTISSPLEAHKPHTVLFSVVGIDVGFENPIFACLELDYEEADSDVSGEAARRAHQSLTYYELDLGLNHVVRKYSEPLEEWANMLINVPGGQDGPGGVLVCCENFIVYKNFGDQPDVRCPIPRRRNELDDPDRSIILVSFAVHKSKSYFFILAQSEQGDIFKISLTVDEDLVSAIRIKYYDTLPVSSSLCILKSGFVFCAAESGGHALYQIVNIDDEREPEFSSSMPLDEGDTFFYAPHPLRNLVLAEEVDSLAPLTAASMVDLLGEEGDGSVQLYALSGRGARGSVRQLRHGLEVTEMAVSDLPSQPTSVWTVRRAARDAQDSYIVVSFTNATLVLAIGEAVEEVTDSGFLGTMPTIDCGLLGEDSLVQVYPDGIRHIRADRRVNEWKTPGKRLITRSALNSRQLVIAVSGTELVYFEMDPLGQLNEFSERREMDSEVRCLALGPIAPGEQRSRFLAVGLEDQTVRIISLDPADCFQPLAMQGLPSVPESLCILHLRAPLAGATVALPDSVAKPQAAAITLDDDEDTTPAGTAGHSSTYLLIGLQNGVLLRTLLDTVTGDLSDTRTRYLGTRAVRLFRVRVQDGDAALCASSRTYLQYSMHGHARFQLAPLCYTPFEYAASFASEQCPEGIVAIAGSTLRIVALEKLGGLFHSISAPTSHTPRRFVAHPETQSLVVIETDHNCFTEPAKLERKKMLADSMIASASADEKQEAVEIAQAFVNEELPEATFGQPKAGAGFWASAIRVWNVRSQETSQVLPLDQNEAALSIALVKFTAYPDHQFVLVGGAKQLVLSPRSCKSGFINVYRIEHCDPQLATENARPSLRLQFLHQTIVEDAVYALAPFHGRVAVGVGNLLRLYDLGKKKLLRKCESKDISNCIVGLHTLSNRLYVSDVQDSVCFVRYKHAENQLIVFADDVLPRWVTCSTLLDYDTVVAGDKFGNVFVLRLPESVSDNVEGDPSGARSLFEKTSQKAEQVAAFYVGEMLTSLQKTTLSASGAESIVYTTLSGGVGVLAPMTSKEEYELMNNVEMYLRTELPSPVGNDHLRWRSSFWPLQNVVDGDLCECFVQLPYGRQKTISGELDRTPNEISKKLEDLRTRFAF